MIEENLSKKKKFMMKGDSEKLKVILKILIANAIKYTNKGYVKLKTKIEKINDYFNIVIEVQDTGVGIDQEKQNKIFQIFDNYKDKNIINSGGCGIGLTLC